MDGDPYGDGEEEEPGVREGWVRGVRVLTTAGTTAGTSPRHVVVVPGMGALAYLLPLVRALDRGGATATLLDLPGFGHPEGGCRPTVRAVAAEAARWCAGLPGGTELVLLGHSTGAVSALLAAVALEREGRPPAAVVLAAPVAAPNQRSLPRMIARAPLAYRRESLGELTVLRDYRRAGRDALTLLRSAVAERPERTVRELRSPLLVTAGRADAFAPPGWLVMLAHAAAARVAHVVRLPGSHNNPFTHPVELAGQVLAHADAAAGRAARRGGRRRLSAAGRR